jgi:hypothetical protein
MFNKIYVGAAAISVIITSFLTYYSASWLGSIGSPARTIENFDYFAGASQDALWLSSIVLLILANVILWNSRRAWAMWTTLLYFAVFTVLWYFWLYPSYGHFREANNVPAAGLLSGPFLGTGILLAAAAVVFFDQFLVLRLLDKMHPIAGPNTNGPETAIDEGGAPKE